MTTSRWIPRGLAATLLALGVAHAATAGNVFVTGHDPDFHAVQGANAAGAQNVLTSALNFARNGNTAPILYIQSNTSNNALGDHTDSEACLATIGYTAGNTPGNHYVKVDSTQFALANLPLYSALFVPSDHGGSLTGDDLAALNARQGAIVSYVNSGGGLVVLTEDGNRQPASVGPQPSNYGFLPTVVGAASVSQGENGFTLTPLGTSLGLTTNDVNGNFSHSIFTSYAGFQIVDQDAAGNVVTIAASGNIPEPASAALALLGMCAVVASQRRR